MNSELRAFIDRAIIPALVDRFLAEQSRPRLSVRPADAIDGPLDEPGYDSGGWVTR